MDVMNARGCFIRKSKYTGKEKTTMAGITPKRKI
jgi:hypothetical protein